MHLIFPALVNNWHFFKWKFALYTSSAGFCHICIVVDLSYATGDNFPVVFFTDTRSTMHNKWNIYSRFNILKYRHIKLRLGQIQTMCCSKWTSQCINTCFINKCFCQFRICIDFLRLIACRDSVIMSQSKFAFTESTNLCFYGCTFCMRKFDCDLSISHIFFIWKSRSVKHYRCKSNI